MVKIENLSKSFDNKKVLSSFSAEFSDGINGISAPSGIGKTTLLRIIAGLEVPDEGTVSGVGKISMDFQEPRLIPWITAGKNAAIAEKSHGLGKEILCRLGLGNEIDTMPGQLSGGMQKRVSLARALACEFDTLLLDEPFSGLDAKTADDALDTVRSYSKERCVILVTHSAETLAKLDSVIYL